MPSLRSSLSLQLWSDAIRPSCHRMDGTVCRNWPTPVAPFALALVPCKLGVTPPFSNSSTTSPSYHPPESKATWLRSSTEAFNSHIFSSSPYFTPVFLITVISFPSWPNFGWRWVAPVNPNTQKIEWTVLPENYWNCRYFTLFISYPNWTGITTIHDEDVAIRN